MTEVGVFVITQPPPKRKSQIGSYLRMHLSYVGEDNFAYIESDCGNETLFIFSDIENHRDFYNLFTKYEMLVSYQVLTKDFLFQKNLHNIFNKGKFKKVLTFYHREKFLEFVKEFYPNICHAKTFNVLNFYRTNVYYAKKMPLKYLKTKEAIESVLGRKKVILEVLKSNSELSTSKIRRVYQNEGFFYGNELKKKI
jgi:hypothetical protein